ncbi:MAG: hypothetical protein KF871_18595, partial [Hydrogenophaga sp.]|nr:hypothetical protein [Hydrogenophaga sp.]
MSNSDQQPESVPSGVSVEQHIAEAQAYADSHTIAETYYWFYLKVRNKGEWDYKQQGKVYEEFGNWHYGVIGTALGIPEEILKRMAGFAQIRAKTSTGENWGNPFTHAPYGDDPNDQDAIMRGIEWARKNGHETSMLFPEHQINLPMTWDIEGWEMNSAAYTTYLTATSTRPQPIYYDPLAIDLDGDGIETVGIGSAPITFDHNADGVRTGTGWVTGDDAWLVIDRNGNGSIDSGRELFGVDYLKANNQLATSGLDALADLDSNGDGVFNASDAAFAQVQLWQDLNQDGISQSNELFGLADKGIASISLTGTTAGTNLGNGNTVATSAVVTRDDGSTTTAADLNAAHNPFYRSFANDIVVSDTAQALPEMGGAGWVRDLREAMSLSELQAAEQAQAPDYELPATQGEPARPLIDVVAEFAAATTKAGQTALLDELLRAWAATNQYVALKPVDDPLRRLVVANDPAMSARMQAIIPVLEIFNGLGVAQAGMQNPTLSSLAMADGSTQQVQTYTLFAEQVQPMLNAYEQLRQSVYGALIMQTRLKPYMDAVELVIDDNGIRFDTAGIDALAQQHASTDPLNAITDLLDLRRYGSDAL